MKRIFLAIMAVSMAAAIHAGAAIAADRPLVQCDTHAECRNIRNVIAFYRAAINDKDFAAASRYLGDEYIQHNPNAPDGAAGLKAFITHLRSDLPKYHSVIVRAFGTGNYVILHVHNTHTPGTNGFVIVDIFRLRGGKIVEHWDVHQPVADHSANGHSMY